MLSKGKYEPALQLLDTVVEVSSFVSNSRISIKCCDYYFFEKKINFKLSYTQAWHCIGQIDHKLLLVPESMFRQRVMLRKVLLSALFVTKKQSLSLLFLSLIFCETVVWLKPEWHKGYQRMGEVLYAERNYEAACSWYAKALGFKPGFLFFI